MGCMYVCVVPITKSQKDILEILRILIITYIQVLFICGMVHVLYMRVLYVVGTSFMYLTEMGGGTSSKDGEVLA